MVIFIYKANLTFFVKSPSEEFLLIKQFDMNVHSIPLNTKRGSEGSSNIGLIYDRVLSHKNHLLSGETVFDSFINSILD